MKMITFQLRTKDGKSIVDKSRVCFHESQRKCLLMPGPKGSTLLLHLIAYTFFVAKVKLPLLALQLASIPCKCPLRMEGNRVDLGTKHQHKSLWSLRY